MPGVVKNDSVEFLVSEIISPTHERRWVALYLAGAGGEDYEGIVNCVVRTIPALGSWRHDANGEFPHSPPA